MLEYTLYVDVWLLRLGCNYLFEYLLLWATATITRTPTTATRLTLGSLIGTVHYGLYLAASVGLLPLYGLLRFFPVVLLVSAAMLGATFYPLGWRKLLTAAGYFYTIGFVAAGVGLAGAYLFGPSGSPSFTLGTVLSVLTILLIAELGWGIVHERVVRTIYRVPVEITCDGQKIKMTALVDTGNHLKDPLNRQSVIIVDAAPNRAAPGGVCGCPRTRARRSRGSRATHQFENLAHPAAAHPLQLHRPDQRDDAGLPA